MIRVTALAAILAGVAVLAGTFPGAAPTVGVNVAPIRYDELGERIAGQRGSVVVVDFWADYCLPCKKEFPRLVELNRKYSRRGLVAVAVSLDDPSDADARDRVQKFLTAQQAAFRNFLLDEKPQVWQARLKIDGPPCVFLFNRRGDLVKKYHDHVDYDEIDRLVAECLNQ